MRFVSKRCMGAAAGSHNFPMQAASAVVHRVIPVPPAVAYY